VVVGILTFHLVTGHAPTSTSHSAIFHAGDHSLNTLLLKNTFPFYILNNSSKIET